MIDYILCLIVRFVSAVFVLLPVRPLLFMARRLGSLAYYFFGKRKKVAYANLKIAFGKTKEPRELKLILKKVYQNLLQNFFEVLIIPKIDEKYMKKYVKIKGLEHLQQAKAMNKGILFLTAHLGNWELAGISGALLGYPMSILVREQKMERLNTLLNEYRTSKGGGVITKGISTRELVKTLRNNGIIGMVADQDAGKTGVFVEFFNRMTSSPDGLVAFAGRTQAIIMPSFLIREKGPYHTQYVEPPLVLERTPDRELDVAKGVQDFANILEKYVSKYPEQWLWLHKRWKSSPTKDIVVLDDGKAGHLHQALAVAEIIRKQRQDQGYKSGDTRINVVKVEFKSKVNRFLFNVWSLLFSGFPGWGRVECLGFTATKDSYDSIKKSFGNVIISAGSSSSEVNIVISKECNAKSIIIMKPWMGVGRFDLAILPRHDNVKAKNAVITEGAPNIVNDSSMKESSAKLAGSFKLSKKDKIGLLIGGDNDDFVLTKKITEDTINNVVEAAQKLDLEILATTSRRTSKDAEALLEERLKNDPRCGMLVIANKKNIDHAVEGIVGLSKYLVVSGESISMLSEAASSGKTVFAFKLSKRRAKPTRHEFFLYNMAKSRHIYLCEAQDLNARIQKTSSENLATERLNDFKTIYDALGKLF